MQRRAGSLDRGGGALGNVKGPGSLAPLACCSRPKRFACFVRDKLAVVERRPDNHHPGQRVSGYAATQPVERR